MSGDNDSVAEESSPDDLAERDDLADAAEAADEADLLDAEEAEETVAEDDDEDEAPCGRPPTGPESKCWLSRAVSPVLLIDWRALR